MEGVKLKCPYCGSEKFRRMSSEDIEMAFEGKIYTDEPVGDSSVDIQCFECGADSNNEDGLVKCDGTEKEYNVIVDFGTVDMTVWASSLEDAIEKARRVPDGKLEPCIDTVAVVDEDGNEIERG